MERKDGLAGRTGGGRMAGFTKGEVLLSSSAAFILPGSVVIQQVGWRTSWVGPRGLAHPKAIWVERRRRRRPLLQSCASTGTSAPRAPAAPGTSGARMPWAGA